MESLPNFGRLYVHTIHQHAGGPSFCATRLGKKAPYQRLGMKLLWRLSAIFKKGDPACCENYRPISLMIRDQTKLVPVAYVGRNLGLEWLGASMVVDGVREAMDAFIEDLE